ncbi:MAG: dethiobiotin synthase [Dissulfurispiraceae bacterium]
MSQSEPGGAKGVFITGTDTGVGKTFAAAVLIRALIKKGIKVGAMKPVETGCLNRAGNLIPADGMFLKSLAQMDATIDLVSPIRFEHPLAPMVASELEGKAVELGKITDSYHTLSEQYSFMVVEGAGGLLVPIVRIKQEGEHGDQGVYFMVDLMRELRLPVIVVTRPTLGTINQTLLTVNHALRAGLEVIGVLINDAQAPGNTLAEETNPRALKELCPVPILGILPHINDVTLNAIDAVAAGMSVSFLKAG